MSEQWLQCFLALIQFTSGIGFFFIAWKSKEREDFAIGSLAISFAILGFADPMPPSITMTVIMTILFLVGLLIRWQCKGSN